MGEAETGDAAAEKCELGQAGPERSVFEEMGPEEAGHTETAFERPGPEGIRSAELEHPDQEELEHTEMTGSCTDPADSVASGVGMVRREALPNKTYYSHGGSTLVERVGSGG